MSKKKQKPTNQIRKVKSYKSITEYHMPSNGLTILHEERKGTNVITSHIVYKVGARDENRGETGIAHMLEHMLFKPTKFDIKRKTDSGSMKFERDTGIILNATTWKDRTHYFFSYPKEYFERPLQTAAEQMYGVVLNDKEFQPERTNVLSEYDMHAGDPEFALSVDMVSTAFQSHPYGHETIGYREDIENYTVDKLQRFYDKYYATNNATLIIIGDIGERLMKKYVEKHFASLKPSKTFEPRIEITEPIQEGKREISITRDSSQLLLAIGVKHDGFPSPSWYKTAVLFEILAGGEDSIFHKKLVDTGKISSVDEMIEPMFDRNLGILFFKLNKTQNHEKTFEQAIKLIHGLDEKDINPYLKKLIPKMKRQERLSREGSLKFSYALVEYVAASAWEEIFNVETKLKELTSKDIVQHAKLLFSDNNMTVGKYHGTQK